MAEQARTFLVYDIPRLQHDLAAKGWLPTDLAKKAEVSHMTVSRFLRGLAQTPRTAKKLSRALGHPPDHYLLPQAVEATR
jgi:transcriptional regulator with XRE-family HTH domain